MFTAALLANVKRKHNEGQLQELLNSPQNLLTRNTVSCVYHSVFNINVTISVPSIVRPYNRNKDGDKPCT